MKNRRMSMAAASRFEDGTDTSGRRQNSAFEFSIWIRYVLICVTGIHLVLSAYVVHNNLSSSTIISESEDIHALCSYSMASGESLYGPDDLHVQRKDYTPLGFWFLSKAICYGGLDIRYQRMIALIFGAGGIILLGSCAKKLTGSWLWAFMAAALLSGVDASPWFIEVGPQPFLLFFALLGLYLLIRDPLLRWHTVIFAGFAFFASYWSKQTGLAFMATYVVYVFIKNRSKGVVAFLVVTVLTIGSAWWCATRPGSDFIRLVFVWNALDPLIWNRIWNPILFPELTGRFGILVACMLGTLCMTRNNNWKRWFSAPFLFMLTGIASGCFASLKYGSGMLQVLVGYALLILTGLLVLHDWVKARVINPNLAAAMIVVFSLALIRSPQPFIITSQDDFRYQRILSIMKTHPGDVKFFPFQYVNLLVGKQTYTNPLVDSVRRQKDGVLQYRPTWTPLLKDPPWELVITMVPMEYNSSLLGETLQNNYKVIEEMPETGIPGGSLRRRLVVLEKNH